jgi:heme-degrading monooxygenase HmoA
MASEPVILINAFEVPPGADEDFVLGWEQGHDFLRAQEGFLSTRLHRSLTPTVDFRYVNVARWASPEAFRAATGQPEFRSREHPYRFHAALYEVIRSSDH